MRKSSRQYLRLSGVSWKTYLRLLRIFDERPGYHLAYDRGELEIMSPSVQHDDESRLLGDFVVALTDELGLPVKQGGSATLKRQLKKKGIEADECFWIVTAHHLAGVKRLDLRKHPPPDLVIEVDVSRSSLNRLAIYAALGVTEVWRLDEDTLIFYVLQADGTYKATASSHFFPLVTPADLVGFLQQARQSADQNPIFRQFRQWIRQRRGAAGSPPATP